MHAAIAFLRSIGCSNFRPHGQGFDFSPPKGLVISHERCFIRTFRDGYLEEIGGRFTEYRSLDELQKSWE